jgi:hypothetical protein
VGKVLAIIMANTLVTVFDMVGTVVGFIFACRGKNLSQPVQLLCGFCMAIDFFITYVYCTKVDFPHRQKVFMIGKVLGAAAIVIVALSAVLPPNCDVVAFNCLWDWIMRILGHVSNLLKKKSGHQAAENVPLTGSNRRRR